MGKDVNVQIEMDEESCHAIAQWSLHFRTVTLILVLFVR